MDERPSGNPITVRVPATERTKLQIAADVSGVTRSEFVREAAVEAAEQVLARLASMAVDGRRGNGGRRCDG